MIEDEERPTWNQYFAKSAILASTRSNCKRLKVGSVIVKDNHLISMGYNGFISGAEHKSIVRDNHEQATVHSEMNAIIDCARRGVSIENSVIYVTHYPCINCFKCIANSGIKSIFYLEDYNNDPLIDEINRDIQIPISKITT